MDLVDHEDGASALRGAGDGPDLLFEFGQGGEGAVVLPDCVAEGVLCLLGELVDGRQSPFGFGLGPDAVG